MADRVTLYVCAPKPRYSVLDPEEQEYRPATDAEVLSHPAVVKALAAAEERGAARRQEEIVAFLRSEPETVAYCDGHRHADGKPCGTMRDLTLTEAADIIERAAPAEAPDAREGKRVAYVCLTCGHRYEAPCQCHGELTEKAPDAGDAADRAVGEPPKETPR